MVMAMMTLMPVMDWMVGIVVWITMTGTTTVIITVTITTVLAIVIGIGIGIGIEITAVVHIGMTIVSMLVRAVLL